MTIKTRLIDFINNDCALDYDLILKTENIDSDVLLDLLKYNLKTKHAFAIDYQNTCLYISTDEDYKPFDKGSKFEIKIITNLNLDELEFVEENNVKFISKIEEVYKEPQLSDFIHSSGKLDGPKINKSDIKDKRLILDLIEYNDKFSKTIKVPEVEQLLKEIIKRKISNYEFLSLTKHNIKLFVTNPMQEVQDCYNSHKIENVLLLGQQKDGDKSYTIHCMINSNPIFKRNGDRLNKEIINSIKKELSVENKENTIKLNDLINEDGNLKYNDIEKIYNVDKKLLVELIELSETKYENEEDDKKRTKLVIIENGDDTYSIVCTKNPSPEILSALISFESENNILKSIKEELKNNKIKTPKYK